MKSLAKLGPKLASLGSDILAKVVQWFGDMINKAVEYGPKFVDSLVEKVKNLPKELGNILVNGIKKVTKFGSDIKNSAKNAGEKLVSSLKDAIKGLPSDIREIGNHIIDGFWNGINDKLDWLTGKIKEFANSVTDKLKSFFGIHSPSRVMRDQVGKYLALGVAEGVDMYKDKVHAAMKRLATEAQDVSDIYNIVDIDDVKKHMPKPDPKGPSSGGGSTTNNNTYTFVQNNTSPKSLNRLEIYRQTKNLIKLKPEVT